MKAVTFQGTKDIQGKQGDRIVLPFNISCGHCYYCEHEMESQCV